MVASFIQSLALAKKTLEHLDFLEKYNPSVVFPHNYVVQLRGKSYREQWELYTKNYWYQFMLQDGSLLIYEDHSFRYLMAPVKFPSREDFIHEEFGDIWYSGFNDEDRNDYLSSSDYALAFHSYVESTSTLCAATPVRYDMSLDKEEYCRLTHPAFHLHIGFENNSRIPVKVQMTPFSFMAFIIATFYPNEWRRLINDGIIKPVDIPKIKSSLNTTPHINKELWCSQFEETRIFIG